jgi:hypothetical protein
MVNLIFLLMGQSYVKIALNVRCRMYANKFRQQSLIDSKIDDLVSSSKLLMSKKDVNESRRRIIRYDNVGDPIYEDEENASGNNGISVLGINISLDPTSLTLIIFGLIAFNFFVLANM